MKLPLIISCLALPLSAQLRITEVMSDSNHSEADARGDWFEITNTGNSSVNLSGFSFDDDSAEAGTSGSFPPVLLAAGSSMIVLDEADSTLFRSIWSIPAGVRIISNSELSAFPGFGRNGDAVNLYNNGGSLIDTFTFGAASEGFSFARFLNGNAVPGELSSDGFFGAYESNDPSVDIASPGLAENLPDPLPPFFNGPFTTAGVANTSLANSAFRITSIDPNPGDTITISSSGTPPWLSINDLGGGIASLSGTPPTSAVGPHEFEITATDDSNRTSSQSYRIDVLAPSSPIILNEYNAVSADEFLGGGEEDELDGASDPFFGRIAGNGGPWVEFVITETSDLRNWTLEINSDDGSRTLKLSNHIALSAIPAGTILTFTESNEFSPTALNQVSLLTSAGYTWSNIWMHDPVLIDQSNSSHPTTPAINSSQTVFTWLDASDAIVYGPSGESVAIQDSDDNGSGDTLSSVGGSELLRLEADPNSSVSPLNLNYDDGRSSTFGAPNIWSDGSMTQSFAAFISANTPPTLGPVSSQKSVRGEYAATAPNSGTNFSIIAAPSFLNISFSSTEITITNNRPLTFDDIGTYEVSLSSDNGATNYLAYQLEVTNPTPALILNEYNAVAPDRFLNGGTLSTDEDGGPAASDSHFARVAGNGGHWFELALLGDGGPGFTNLHNWSIDVGKMTSFGLFIPSSTITLSDASTWSAVAHGTLLTFIDQNTAGGGLDTEINRVDELSSNGLAWTNIHLGTPGTVSVDGLADFTTDSNNTAFVIRNASGTTIFGPAGEGIAPLGGVGSEEIFELENDPLLTISSCDAASPTALGYDDGSSSSTFGSPNLFAPLGSSTDRAQDFSAFIATLTPLEAYLASVGLPNADPAADSDGDGFSNLEEYLFGGNANDLSVFPQKTIDASTGRITATIRVNDPNFTLTAERSSDLLNWVSEDLEVVDEESPLGPNFVTRNITYLGDEARMFFRFNSQP